MAAKKIKNTTPQKTYIKHLIECKCILPQFRKIESPVFHKFIVFSELEEQTALVKSSFVQCPNCGAVHKVTEIGQSEITNKETLLSLPSIEDIELELPDKLIHLLRRHECELPTWQEAKFIIDNEIWGSVVIVSKDRNSDTVIGKFVTILGKETYKLDTFERFEGLV